MEKRRAYMGKGYKRKAMKRKRRIVRWAIIGVLGVVLVFTFNRGAEGRSGILNSGIKGEKASAYIDLQPVQAGECDPEILGKLQDMAGNDDKVKKLLEQMDQYPEGILEMVANNLETIDFALDYPEKKNMAPADTIGEIERGEIPELLQWDERWGYSSYGDGVLGYTGCGPTALCMVIAGLTGDSSVTPSQIARFADENGYYAEGQGTCWSLMTEGCKNFGVQGRELGLDKNLIYAELEAGNPIICSMKPGDFTTKGHFIVLTGVVDGKIQINDPNSMERSSRLWDYGTIEYQINNLWTFSAIWGGMSG